MLAFSRTLISHSKGVILLRYDSNKDYSFEAEIMKVFGHPIRLKLFAYLCSQQCNVKHLWECFGLPQATVSQHLAQLSRAGIISGKRVGHEMHYSVISPLAKKIIEILG
jgi:ArsR family transcriptional regulator